MRVRTYFVYAYRGTVLLLSCVFIVALVVYQVSYSGTSGLDPQEKIMVPLIMVVMIGYAFFLNWLVGRS